MYSVDLRHYLSTLWRWSWLFVLAAAVAAAISYYYVGRAAPVYVASTTLMVGDPINNPNPSPEQLGISQRLADTYRSMLSRQPLLDAAAKSLRFPMEWQELRARLLVVPVPNSSAFEIRTVDSDPARARDMASVVAQQLIDSTPTIANIREREARRQFISGELEALQAKIENAKSDVDKKRAALTREAGARAVLDLQDQIKGLELSLNDSRSQYRALLTSYDEAGNPNVVTVVESATLPTAPVNPNAKTWNILMAILAGLILALLGVLAIEYMDDTVKTKEDLEAAVGSTSLGVISHMPGQDKTERTLAVLGPDSPSAEAYRALAANLRFAALSHPRKCLLITSPAPGDGKSTTAANLAAALAQGGKNVLLVDLDLRSPSLHQWLDSSNGTGVTTLMTNSSRRIEDCLLSTPIDSLRFLPAGPPPTNPAELVSRFGDELIAKLRSMADFVIIDSPPVLAAADAATLAALVDGVLLIAHSGRTRRGMCTTAKEILERAHSQIIGNVINAVPRASIGFYSYSYRPQKRGRFWGLLGGPTNPPGPRPKAV